MSAMAPAPERPAPSAENEGGRLGTFPDAPLLLLAGAEDESAEPETHICRGID